MTLIEKSIERNPETKEYFQRLAGVNVAFRGFLAKCPYPSIRPDILARLPESPLFRFGFDEFIPDISMETEDHVLNSHRIVGRFRAAVKQDNENNYHFYFCNVPAFGLPAFPLQYEKGGLLPLHHEPDLDHVEGVLKMGTWGFYSIASPPLCALIHHVEEKEPVIVL